MQLQCHWGNFHPSECEEGEDIVVVIVNEHDCMPIFCVDIDRRLIIHSQEKIQEQLYADTNMERTPLLLENSQVE